jgi:hypothetical protein
VNSVACLANTTESQRTEITQLFSGHTLRMTNNFGLHKG